MAYEYLHKVSRYPVPGNSIILIFYVLAVHAGPCTGGCAMELH
jgi:hypothetical protein